MQIQRIVHDHVHSGFMPQDLKRLFLRLQFWGEIQEPENIFSKSLLTVYTIKA